MADPDPSANAARQAADHNEAGLRLYAEWDLQGAIDRFSQAANGDPKNPEYHLNLARAYARGGSYAEAMRSLGEYLHNETNEDLSRRYERLFSSALDEVESRLIDGARKLEQPIQLTGKAIQMWLEYRLTVGRKPLDVPQPNIWAAALLFAAGKINFVEPPRQEVASVFEVSETDLQQKYAALVETLDLIPADYRYFAGEENPLDRLVEAAQVLDEIYKDFEEDE